MSQCVKLHRLTTAGNNSKNIIKLEKNKLRKYILPDFYNKTDKIKIPILKPIPKTEKIKILDFKLIPRIRKRLN